jgi:hypothetical protein
MPYRRAATDRAGLNPAAVAAARERHAATWDCLVCGHPLDRGLALAGTRLHPCCDGPEPMEPWCRRCHLFRPAAIPVRAGEARPPGCRCRRPDLWRPSDRALALTAQRYGPDLAGRPDPVMRAGAMAARGIRLCGPGATHGDLDQVEQVSRELAAVAYERAQQAPYPTPPDGKCPGCDHKHKPHRGACPGKAPSGCQPFAVGDGTGFACGARPPCPCPYRTCGCGLAVQVAAELPELARGIPPGQDEVMIVPVILGSGGDPAGRLAVWDLAGGGLGCRDLAAGEDPGPGEWRGTEHGPAGAECPKESRWSLRRAA